MMDQAELRCRASALGLSWLITKMTCRSCEPSFFLNLIFGSYFEGGWMPWPTAQGLSQVLEGCTCLSAGTLPPHLSGREGVFYNFISLPVCLPHWNLSPMDRGLSSAQGLGEYLVHSRAQ